MIGFCGLVCTQCPGYLATQKNNDNERRKVAQLWSKLYNHEIKPKDINCDGCLSEGSRLISHCSVCEIRRCGKEKNIKNCAYCEEYSCEKLNQFFKMVPDAETTLDEIRNTL